MTLADFTELDLLVPELLNERQESVIAELICRLKGAGRIKNGLASSRAVLDHESIVSMAFERLRSH